MLNLLILLGVIWIVAGVLGFGGIAGAAATILQAIFWAALVLLVLSVIFAVATGRAIFH
jgi:uncharacterized membrane protein YtjA (UPF0391 family)